MFWPPSATVIIQNFFCNNARWQQDRAFCTSTALASVCRLWRDVTAGLTRRNATGSLPQVTARHRDQALAEYLAWRLPLKGNESFGYEMYLKAHGIFAESCDFAPVRPSMTAQVVLRHAYSLHVNDFVRRDDRPAYFTALTEVARQAPFLRTYAEDTELFSNFGAPRSQWPHDFPPEHLFAAMPELREFRAGGICLPPDGAKPFAQLVLAKLETLRLYMLHGEIDWLQGFVLAQPALATVDLRTNDFDVDSLRALFSSFVQWQSVPVSPDVKEPVKRKAFLGAFEARTCASGTDERTIQFLI